MELPLDKRLSIGLQTIHRRTEPANGPWLPRIDEMCALVELIDRSGYDLLWVGDHISFPLHIFDPLLQLAQAAVREPPVAIRHVGLPPAAAASNAGSQASINPRPSDGRPFHFRRRRRRRISEGVRGLRRADHRAGRAAIRGHRRAAEVVARRERLPRRPILRFDEITMQPPPRQSGGPPIWCGGRSDAALRRVGRLTDGWMSYVVTPEMYAQGLVKIAAAAAKAGRRFERGFGTAHLLFARIDETYEKALDVATITLSRRYAMDFRKPAQRYCALGPPAGIAETIQRFYAAGVRHVILDLLGPYEERDRQIELFAAEGLPLLAELRGPARTPADESHAESSPLSTGRPPDSGNRLKPS